MYVLTGLLDVCLIIRARETLRDISNATCKDECTNRGERFELRCSIADSGKDTGYPKCMQPPKKVAPNINTEGTHRDFIILVRLPVWGYISQLNLVS